MRPLTDTEMAYARENTALRQCICDLQNSAQSMAVLLREALDNLTSVEVSAGGPVDLWARLARARVMEFELLTDVDEFSTMQEGS